jgi:hypothetical protein
MSKLINEAAVQRRRLDELDALSDDRPDGPDLGALAVVGITASDGKYPIAAQAVYRLDVQRVVDDEREGGAVELVPTGEKIYAGNVGDAIPPRGTPVIATLVDGGKFIFAYN